MPNLEITRTDGTTATVPQQDAFDLVKNGQAIINPGQTIWLARNGEDLSGQTYILNDNVIRTDTSDPAALARAISNTGEHRDFRWLTPTELARAQRELARENRHTENVTNRQANNDALSNAFTGQTEQQIRDAESIRRQENQQRWMQQADRASTDPSVPMPPSPPLADGGVPMPQEGGVPQGPDASTTTTDGGLGPDVDPQEPPLIPGTTTTALPPEQESTVPNPIEHFSSQAIQAAHVLAQDINVEMPASMINGFTEYLRQRYGVNNRILYYTGEGETRQRHLISAEELKNNPSLLHNLANNYILNDSNGVDLPTDHETAVYRQELADRSPIVEEQTTAAVETARNADGNYEEAITRFINLNASLTGDTEHVYFVERGVVTSLPVSELRTRNLTSTTLLESLSNGRARPLNEEEIHDLRIRNTEARIRRDRVNTDVIVSSNINYSLGVARINDINNITAEEADRLVSSQGTIGLFNYSNRLSHDASTFYYVDLTPDENGNPPVHRRVSSVPRSDKVAVAAVVARMGGDSPTATMPTPVEFSAMFRINALNDVNEQNNRHEVQAAVGDLHRNMAEARLNFARYNSIGPRLHDDGTELTQDELFRWQAAHRTTAQFNQAALQVFNLFGLASGVASGGGGGFYNPITLLSAGLSGGARAVSPYIMPESWAAFFDGSTYDWLTAPQNETVQADNRSILRLGEQENQMGAFGGAIYRSIIEAPLLLGTPIRALSALTKLRTGATLAYEGLGVGEVAEQMTVRAITRALPEAVTTASNLGTVSRLGVTTAGVVVRGVTEGALFGAEMGAAEFSINEEHGLTGFGRTVGGNALHGALAGALLMPVLHGGLYFVGRASQSLFSSEAAAGRINTFLSGGRTKAERFSRFLDSVESQGGITNLSPADREILGHVFSNNDSATLLRADFLDSDGEALFNAASEDLSRYFNLGVEDAATVFRESPLTDVTGPKSTITGEPELLLEFNRAVSTGFDSLSSTTQNRINTAREIIESLLQDANGDVGPGLINKLSRVITAIDRTALVTTSAADRNIVENISDILLQRLKNSTSSVEYSALTSRMQTTRSINTMLRELNNFNSNTEVPSVLRMLDFGDGVTVEFPEFRSSQFRAVLERFGYSDAAAVEAQLDNISKIVIDFNHPESGSVSLARSLGELVSDSSPRTRGRLVINHNNTGTLSRVVKLNALRELAVRSGVSRGTFQQAVEVIAGLARTWPVRKLITSLPGGRALANTIRAGVGLLSREVGGNIIGIEGIFEVLFPKGLSGKNLRAIIESLSTQLETGKKILSIPEIVNAEYISAAERRLATLERSGAGTTEIKQERRLIEYLRDNPNVRPNIFLESIKGPISNLERARANLALATKNLSRMEASSAEEALAGAEITRAIESVKAVIADNESRFEVNVEAHRELVALVDEVSNEINTIGREMGIGRPAEEMFNLEQAAIDRYSPRIRSLDILSPEALERVDNGGNIIRELFQALGTADTTNTGVINAMLENLQKFVQAAQAKETWPMQRVISNIRSIQDVIAQIGGDGGETMTSLTLFNKNSIISSQRASEIDRLFRVIPTELQHEVETGLLDHLRGIILADAESAARGGITEAEVKVKIANLIKRLRERFINASQQRYISVVRNSIDQDIINNADNALIDAITRLENLKTERLSSLTRSDFSSITKPSADNILGYLDVLRSNFKDYITISSQQWSENSMRVSTRFDVSLSAAERNALPELQSQYERAVNELQKELERRSEIRNVTTANPYTGDATNMTTRTIRQEVVNRERDKITDLFIRYRNAYKKLRMQQAYGWPRILEYLGSTNAPNVTWGYLNMKFNPTNEQRADMARVYNAEARFIESQYHARYALHNMNFENNFRGRREYRTALAIDSIHYDGTREGLYHSVRRMARISDPVGFLRDQALEGTLELEDLIEIKHVAPGAYELETQNLTTLLRETERTALYGRLIFLLAQVENQPQPPVPSASIPQQTPNPTNPPVGNTRGNVTQAEGRAIQTSPEPQTESQRLAAPGNSNPTQ